MSITVEPKILQGFMELLPREQVVFNRIYDKIREVYERFGFLPIDTPTIERSDVLLAKAGGETEKQIYRFTKGENDIALRFDLTVPLARYVAMHQGELVFPFKRYQISKVFRGERPQKGRYREFYQSDIDIVGAEELPLAYDAEIPTVIYNVFRELKLGDFVINLNNRRLLGGFFESIGYAEKTADILHIVDKLDKIGADNVKKELLASGIDEAGIGNIIEFISLDGTTDEILGKLGDISADKNDDFKKGLSELTEVCAYLRGFGVPDENFRLNLTIARGLDYYTGTVYETFLRGHENIGSVCSGGRYDNLTGYYTDKKLPGIGVSIGLTRLYSALRSENLIEAEGESLTKVLVVPMSREVMPSAVAAAGAFRAAGINTDVYYGEKGMKPKMKYANRLGIPFVAIIGETEAAEGKVMLKNMTLGEQSVLSPGEAAEIIIAKTRQ